MQEAGVLCIVVRVLHQVEMLRSRINSIVLFLCCTNEVRISERKSNSRHVDALAV